MRYSEADRILHLYTLGRGRVSAIAKGVRKTKSRFGARLEPLSHVELLLHEGSGDLHTVTGVDLIASHHATREDGYRAGVGLIGAEAMLRLFGEPEANSRAFAALTRFLDVLDEAPATVHERPSHDALALAFQLKLLWVSGYLPHVKSCVECGVTDGLVGFSARAGGAVCRLHAAGAISLSPDGLAGIEGLLSTPLADAWAAPISDRARRRHHLLRGARRLPAPHPLGMRRVLGDGFELDDDRDRIDVAAVHRYIAEDSYWAKGREYAVMEMLIAEAARVVGLYRDGRQVGFCRAARCSPALFYLADVYVLEECRGRGLGVELVREMVANGPIEESRWLLHTSDAHGLYRKFGFGQPGPKLLERGAPPDHA